MYQRQVTFTEAIQKALVQNYCNFDGRASRSEYWWYALFTFILSAAISLICGRDTFGEIVSCIVSLALLLPGLGLAVRRLHDIGNSGWWIFIALIPLIGWIWLLIKLATNSQMTPNEYGPVPNLQ